jgi:hypothetical protein
MPDLNHGVGWHGWQSCIQGSGATASGSGCVQRVQTGQVSELVHQQRACLMVSHHAIGCQKQEFIIIIDQLTGYVLQTTATVINTRCSSPACVHTPCRSTPVVSSWAQTEPVQFLEEGGELGGGMPVSQ